MGFEIGAGGCEVSICRVRCGDAAALTPPSHPQPQLLFWSSQYMSPKRLGLPHFALQEGNPPERFEQLCTLPEGGEGPNVASQFLVFLLSHFTSRGSQGISLPYPTALRNSRQEMFRITRPQVDARNGVTQ